MCIQTANFCIFNTDFQVISEFFFLIIYPVSVFTLFQKPVSAIYTRESSQASYHIIVFSLLCEKGMKLM